MLKSATTLLTFATSTELAEDEESVSLRASSSGSMCWSSLIASKSLVWQLNMNLKPNPKNLKCKSSINVAVNLIPDPLQTGLLAGVAAHGQWSKAGGLSQADAQHAARLKRARSQSSNGQAHTGRPFADCRQVFPQAVRPQLTLVVKQADGLVHEMFRKVPPALAGTKDCGHHLRPRNVTKIENCLAVACHILQANALRASSLEAFATVVADQ